MKKFLLFISMAILAMNFSTAQTVLAPGDIAILGIQADTPDDFQFVTFVELAAGTEIRFTDSGVLSDGTFRGNEGGVKYTAPDVIPAGTIIGLISNASNFVADNDAIIGNNGLALSTSGDQVIAFQGLSDNPTFLYIMSISSTVWHTGTDDSNQTDLPPGLIDGYTAVTIGWSDGPEDEWDNAVYNMDLTSGTVSDLLMVIGDSDFYLKLYSIADYVEPTGSFTVLADVTDTDAPVWETNYPEVEAFDVKLEITGMMDEVGTVSYMVVPSGSDAPTSAQVIAGIDYGTVTLTGSGSFIGFNAETMATVTGLSTLVDYDVYVVAADNESVPNVQATPTLISVSTALSADASLSDILIDGVSLEGFSGDDTVYTYTLPVGETVIPLVTFTTNVSSSTGIMTVATDLASDSAARTTAIGVTAQNGTAILNYTVQFNPILEVATIADLRAVTDLDRTYTVTGEVILTHKDSYRNKKFFEDASGAMEIDDEPGIITRDYNIGDGLKGLTGTIEDYYGWWQMHPTTDLDTAFSKENLVEPQLLTISEFNTNFDDYAAEFVKIDRVSFADGGGTFANLNNYVISIGESASVVRTHFFGITGAIPYMADVQGIAIWHFDEAKIALRMQSDIILAYSSDGSLSDLMLDAVSVAGFDAATFTYDVLLDVGTTTVPTVTATATDANATAVVTDATDLFGDEAARTTSVEVTAEDGSTTTYTIVFTVDNTGVANAISNKLSLYPVPATDVLNIKGINGIKSLDIVNILGRVVKTINVESESMRINISDLSEGVYFIRAAEYTYRFIKK